MLGSRLSGLRVVLLKVEAGTGLTSDWRFCEAAVYRCADAGPDVVPWVDGVRATFSDTALNIWTSLVVFRLQWPILHIRYMGMWQVSSVQVFELVTCVCGGIGLIVVLAVLCSSGDDNFKVGDGRFPGLESPVMVAVWRTPLTVVGSVGNPGVVCGKEPAGGFTSAELFFIIVMVVVRILGGIVETVSRVEVRMDVTKTTLVETTDGATVMGGGLVAVFDKSKAAEISKVIIATVVGMMAITVGTASGDDVVMYIGTGKIDGDCVTVTVVYVNTVQLTIVVGSDV